MTTEILLTIAAIVIGLIGSMIKIHSWLNERDEKLMSAIRLVETNTRDRIDTCAEKLRVSLDNKAEKDDVEDQINRLVNILSETRDQLLSVLTKGR